MNPTTTTQDPVLDPSSNATGLLTEAVGPLSIAEGFTNEIRFNVMPGKPVAETLTIHRYEIEGDRIRAFFDREYRSSMEKSPSHLIFLTTLIHTQKLLYALLCHKLGLPYDPQGREVLKIWPYDFQIQLPRPIVREKGLIQDLRLVELLRVNDTRYEVVWESNVGTSAHYRIKAAVFLNP